MAEGSSALGKEPAPTDTVLHQLGPVVVKLGQELGIETSLSVEEEALAVSGDTSMSHRHSTRRLSLPGPSEVQVNASIGLLDTPGSDCTGCHGNEWAATPGISRLGGLTEPHWAALPIAFSHHSGLGQSRTAAVSAGSVATARGGRA